MTMTPETARLLLGLRMEEKAKSEGRHLVMCEATREDALDSVVASPDLLAALIDHRAFGRHLTADQLRALLEGAEEAGTVEQVPVRTPGAVGVNDCSWRVMEAPS